MTESNETIVRFLGPKLSNASPVVAQPASAGATPVKSNQNQGSNASESSDMKVEAGKQPGIVEKAHKEVKPRKKPVSSQKVVPGLQVESGQNQELLQVDASNPPLAAGSDQPGSAPAKKPAKPRAKPQPKVKPVESPGKSQDTDMLKSESGTADSSSQSVDSSSQSVDSLSQSLPVQPTPPPHAKVCGVWFTAQVPSHVHTAGYTEPSWDPKIVMETLCVEPVWEDAAETSVSSKDTGKTGKNTKDGKGASKSKSKPAPKSKASESKSKANESKAETSADSKDSAADAVESIEVGKSGPKLEDATSVALHVRKTKEKFMRQRRSALKSQYALVGPEKEITAATKQLQVEEKRLKTEMDADVKAVTAQSTAERTRVLELIASRRKAELFPLQAEAKSRRQSIEQELASQIASLDSMYEAAGGFGESTRQLGSSRMARKQIETTAAEKLKTQVQPLERQCVQLSIELDSEEQNAHDSLETAVERVTSSWKKKLAKLKAQVDNTKASILARHKTELTHLNSSLTVRVEYEWLAGLEAIAKAHKDKQMHYLFPKAVKVAFDLPDDKASAISVMDAVREKELDTVREGKPVKGSKGQGSQTVAQGITSQAKLASLILPRCIECKWRVRELVPQMNKMCVDCFKYSVHEEMIETLGLRPNWHKGGPQKPLTAYAMQLYEAFKDARIADSEISLGDVNYQVGLEWAKASKDSKAILAAMRKPGFREETLLESKPFMPLVRVVGVSQDLLSESAEKRNSSGSAIRGSSFTSSYIASKNSPSSNLPAASSSVSSTPNSVSSTSTMLSGSVTGLPLHLVAEWKKRNVLLEMLQDVISACNSAEENEPGLGHQSQADDSDLDEVTDLCIKCMKTDNENLLLRCDRDVLVGERTCDGLLHTYCCSPSLETSVPEGSWYCCKLCGMVGDGAGSGKARQSKGVGGRSHAGRHSQGHQKNSTQDAARARERLRVANELMTSEAKARRNRFVLDNWSVFAPVVPADKRSRLLAKLEESRPQGGGPASDGSGLIDEPMSTIEQEPAESSSTDPFLAQSLSVDSSSPTSSASLAASKYLPILSGSVNADLRDYQLEGIFWLCAQHERGANSILGDEMGLGKTIQTLSFLAIVKELNLSSPGINLVVCPLSVMPNWVSESAKFTPSLVIKSLHGTVTEREKQKLDIVTTFKSTGVDILATTYEQLVQEIDWVQSNFCFRYLILDEAQRIKSSESAVHGCCRQVRCASKLLLTGTVFQNNLDELYAVMSFLYPDVFPQGTSVKQIAESTSSSFAGSSSVDVSMEPDQGASSSEESSPEQLLFTDSDRHIASSFARVLKLLMLRRLKAQVLAKDLPPKNEIVVSAPLGPEQQGLYRGILQSAAFAAANSEVGRSMNSLIMELVKCCLHPFLLRDYSRESDSSKRSRSEGALSGTVNDNSPASESGKEQNISETVDRSIILKSSKMCLLDGLLSHLFAERSKTLIYSQYTSMLDILEEYLQWRGYRYLRLDGSTSLGCRKLRMHLFNSPRYNKPDEWDTKTYFVFLVSTKAGGVGVNLQSANSVILYDSSWNPFVDAQAQDRTHRIGQKKNVTVYRLLTSGTCEERIRAFAESKMKLKNTLLDESTDDSSTMESDLKKFFSASSTKDVQEVLDMLKDTGSHDESMGAGSTSESDKQTDELRYYDKCQELLQSQILGANKDRPTTEEGAPSSVGGASGLSDERSGPSTTSTSPGRDSFSGKNGDSFSGKNGLSLDKGMDLLPEAHAAGFGSISDNSTGLKSPHASSRTELLSPVKRNVHIRRYEESDYSGKSAETLSALKRAEEQKILDTIALGEKTRERKRMTVTMDTHVRGLGKLEFSKWSIEQERKEQVSEQREFARIQANKLIVNRKVLAYDYDCIHCHKSVLRHRFTVDEEGNKVLSKYAAYVACYSCPATMHVACYNLAVYGNEPIDLVERVRDREEKLKLELKLDEPQEDEDVDMSGNESDEDESENDYSEIDDDEENGEDSATKKGSTKKPSSSKSKGPGQDKSKASKALGVDVICKTCPLHKCKVCSKTASNAGGLILRCLGCPTSLCFNCIAQYSMLDSFEYVDKSDSRNTWEKELGHSYSVNTDIMMCPSCL